MEYFSFKDVDAGLILTGFAKTKDALEYIQFCHDAFFPPWSVSMGPWYPFSYMVAMNIDLYGQLSDWFILWIIIHAYEADRSCVNTMTIDMNSKDCWYEHVIVNMNINITQMNPHKQPMSYKWTDDRWYESQLSYLISWHFHVIMNDFMTPISTTEICHQLIPWDIIDIAGILVPQKYLTN